MTVSLLTKAALPAAALALAAIGMAGGSTAQSGSGQTQTGPLNCEIAVSTGRYGRTYEGLVHAAKDTSGSYELTINKRGASGRAMISQSGTFHVAAGDSETLGQATFGGLPPSSVIAELTLRWNGQTLTCDNDIDL